VFETRRLFFSLVTVNTEDLHYSLKACSYTMYTMFEAETFGLGDNFWKSCTSLMACHQSNFCLWQGVLLNAEIKHKCLRRQAFVTSLWEPRFVRLFSSFTKTSFSGKFWGKI